MGKLAGICETGGWCLHATRFRGCQRGRAASDLASALAAMPLPDAFKQIQAYDQIGRRPGEVIGDFIVREQRPFREMTEAICRVRNAREARDSRTAWPSLSTWWTTRKGEPSHRGGWKFQVKLSSSWRFGATVFSKNARIPVFVRAPDGPGWDEKRLGVRRRGDTVA